MPAEPFFCQFCDLLDAFLHDVFAKIELSRGGRFDDLLERLFLADREQVDVSGPAPGFHRCFGQQIADYSQVFRDSNHVLVRVLRYTTLNIRRVMVSPAAHNEGEIWPSTLRSCCRSR
jgi:hypothetical protein